VLRHDARLDVQRGGLTVRSLLLFLFAALLGSLASAQVLKPVVVAKGLDHPWGLAFLPDGRLLVTERAGRMRIVERDGRLNAPLAGVPPVVAAGQGGLLDVVLHPQFASNQLVYWTYSEAGDGGSATVVARGKLDGNTLANVQVIFRQMPKVSGGNNHFGSRLVWSHDGKLFVGLGDRFTRKDDAQTLDNHMGKVVRIEADGKPAADNPFVSRVGAKAEIWSYGHRNIQGAALHPTSGELWTVEHGPQGGDELNVPAAGANHGWPVITHGRNYGIGTKIGEGTERADVAAALRIWIPSIAPSGMAFVTSDRYPGWKGNLFVGALRGSHLVRLELDGRKVVKDETLLAERNERIRDVRQGPDGWLYVLTDSADGQIWRLER
jgi:aldose sugar dehydrogenase